MTTITDALAVFARGFAFTRSMTHPYVAELLEDGVWVVRDAPRTRQDGYRSEEYIGCGVEPAAMDALARAQTRGRYSICAVLPLAEVGGAGERDSRAAYQALGYRLRTTEALMTHELNGLPATIDAPAGAAVTVRRVTTTEEAAALAKVARRRQILLEHLPSDAQLAPPQRQYVAWDGDAPIGWVASIVVGKYAWCSAMYVAPTHRRRGIARALLLHMLADDCAAGAQANVLLASHAGAKLYPGVGYRQIGTLFAFMPKRSGTDHAPGG